MSVKKERQQSFCGKVSIIAAFLFIYCADLEFCDTTWI